MRRRWVFLGLVACGGAAPGSGPSADTSGTLEDAVEWCDGQRTQQAGCFEDATYDACLACFTDCGGPCPVAESCPVQYPGCG